MIFNYIRNKRINTAFKKNKRKHFFHNLRTMERVLILFHHKDWMQIQLVANDLTKNGKEVILWTVESLDDNIAGIKIPLAMRKLNKEDFSKIGYLKPKVIKEFKELKYDTLFDFTQEDGDGIEYLSFLLAINQAQFCIGRREHLPRVYDLTILQAKGKSILETFGQMKVYLQNIIP